MKTLIFFATLAGIMLSGITAVAQNSGISEILTCSVQVEGQEPQISLSVVLQAETSADFVMLKLIDKTEETMFFTQVDKGEVARSLAQGNLTGMMLQEDFSMDNGAIRNAGIFTVNFANGEGQGLFAAKGNIYPLTCKLN